MQVEAKNIIVALELKRKKTEILRLRMALYVPADKGLQSRVSRDIIKTGEKRCNPYHDPKTGRFTTKSGAGVAGADTSGGRYIINAEIEKGRIKLEINHEKQARHIKGTPEYVEGKSYLTISENDAQNIINQKAGIGRQIRDKSGKLLKERIDCDREIGVYIDPKTKQETVTDKGTIHYSKSGTHLVPRKETKKND